MKKPENSGVKNIGPPCCASTQASQIVALTSTMGLRTGRLSENFKVLADELSRIYKYKNVKKR
jgi:hypothetical protein